MLVSVLVLVIAKPLNHNWGQWGLDYLHKERKTKHVMRCFEWKGSRSQLWSVASVIIKCLNDWINSYYLVIVCQVQSRREECSDLCDCIYQLYSWFLRKLDIPVIRRLSGDKLKAVFITTPVYCTRAARVALYFSCVLKATHTGRVLYPPLSAYCIDLAPGPPAPSLCSPSSFSLLPFFCSPSQPLPVANCSNTKKQASVDICRNWCEDGRGFEVVYYKAWIYVVHCVWYFDQCISGEITTISDDQTLQNPWDFSILRTR